jgi:hypothetical protein
VLIGWLAAICAVDAHGAVRESAIKAAYLLKFPNFVEWPAGTFGGAQDPLVIAVYGDDEVAAELEQLTASRRAEGRPVTVRRLREGEPPGKPHILYAAGPREMRARELLASATGPVLTVTDGPAESPDSAVLAFVVADGQVRFNASLTAAAAHNLRLSARLLAVANQVEGRP